MEIRECIERALSDWAATGTIDASGLAYAILHDLHSAGYKITPIGRGVEIRDYEPPPLPHKCASLTGNRCDICFELIEMEPLR